MNINVRLRRAPPIKLRFQPGATGPAGTIAINSVITGAPGSDVLIENVGTAEAAILNITIPRGNTGLTGDKGWSPILAIVSDGTRRVLQLVDWAGGQGAKPAPGLYVGAAGLVSDIASAVDIRGPQGIPGSVTTGDKGDIIVSGTGDTWMLDRAAVSGTAAGDMVRLDGAGKLPAVSGENLTGVPVGDASVAARNLATSAIGARIGMLNGTLSLTRAGGAETWAVKTLAGTNPSAANPVYFVFGDGAGGFVVRMVTAALSVVASSGATFGTANGAAFKIWCVAADDAGIVRLALVNVRSGKSIMSLSEALLFSSTAISGTATAAQTLYSGTAFANRRICLLGYAEWNSGLAAAGTWNTAPDPVVLFGPGVPRPGERVQIQQVEKTDTFTSTAAGSYQDITGLSATITLTSAANLVRAVPRVQGSTDDAGNALNFALVRGSTQVGGGAASGSRVGSFGGFVRTTDGNSNIGATAEIFDAPGVSTPLTYKVQFITQSGGGAYINRTRLDSDVAGVTRSSSSLTLEELAA